MPVLIDHDGRRTELAEAVWRVVRRDGVAGASVRAVAAEAGLSAGSVRYFYADQRELLHHSLRVLSDRVRARVAADELARRRLVAAGRADEAVVHLLRQVLPLRPEQVNEARIWWAFVAHDPADDAVRALRRELDDEVRDLCRQCIAGLVETGRFGRGRDVQRESVTLWALIDGLTLRLLLDPDRLSTRAATAVLRSHVRQLAGDQATATSPPGRVIPKPVE